jgi:hypothetical protein
MTTSQNGKANPELNLDPIGRMRCHCKENFINVCYMHSLYQQSCRCQPTQICPYFGSVCPNYNEPLTRQQFMDRSHGRHVTLIHPQNYNPRQPFSF